MKHTFSKIALAALLASTSAMADNYSFNAKSLFGIEAGYNSADTTVTGGSNQSSDDFGSAGLKVGAETKNFRVFLNANYLDIPDFDYGYTYGGALQYKFNFMKEANFFVGVNGGVAEMRHSPLNGVSQDSISSSYVGGDAGFNYHATELIDLELAGRVINIADLPDNITTIYASIIFKYDLD